MQERKKEKECKMEGWQIGREEWWKEDEQAGEKERRHTGRKKD